MQVVISSGHSKKVRGASGYIDEVDEARRVTEEVARVLRTQGVEVTTFHDDVSTSQSENLDRIVDFHNSKTRDLDVSIHFNAYETTSKAMGSEVLYASSSGEDYATLVVDAICVSSSLINRGAKKRTDLAFLNGTEETAILVEVCFVDSKADVDIYHAKFDEICGAITEGISGIEAGSDRPPFRPTEPEPEPVPPADIEAIVAIAGASEIYHYAWKDRGVAPQGYMNGFALAWAQVVRRFLTNDSVVLEMAKADTHDDDKDALSWYHEDFEALGMSNTYAGLDTLRHLYALLLGHGMRESSGKHCCGRDQSASNTDGNTCEAGLYQTSYNAHTCSIEFDNVMEDFEDGRCEGFREAFSEGVECSSADWKCYGSGAGLAFQELCKNAPAFAVETCALVLRNLRQHYGPINRKESELRRESDWMLLDVQRYVMQEANRQS